MNNNAAIPPNLIAIPNTESNGHYQKYCKDNNLEPHPARFAAALPEFFMRMLTDPGDIVIDPFCGSCVTEEVAERLRRKWVCIDVNEEYLKGAMGRFNRSANFFQETTETTSYKLHRPAALWDDAVDDPLPSDGGSARP